jgi:hypothetical protein
MRYSRIALIGFTLLVWAGAAAAQQQPGDCGYYVNRDGRTVPRPCGNVREEPPPREATAVCRDGTYSYSQHHSGTCSGHDGVQSWRR